MSNKVEIAGYDEHSNHLRRREVALHEGRLKVYEPTLTTIDESLNNIELDIDKIEVIVNDKVSGLLGRHSCDKASVYSANGIAIFADSSPAPTLDTADQRDGWLWEKIGAGTDKFNYYMYGATGSSKQYTFADLKGIHATGSVDAFVDITSVPFFCAYSKPTGSGDAGAFYHSRKTFSCNLVSPNNVIAGEPCNWYHGAKPIFNNNNRDIELTNLSLDGDCLDTEELLFITVHSDSGGAIGTKILLSDMGYNCDNVVKRNIRLV